jgi:pimeloyl-ACP methyl ester carboxylesterase
MTADSMTIEQILSDAHELVGFLKQSFNKEKIYLLGHSWGSILGALLASRYPEDFHAYIGMGQWVSMSDNERLCYEFTLGEAERRGDRKAVAQLERIGAPENGLYRGDWLGGVKAQRTYLKQYGGFLYGRSGILDLHFGSYLRTTEYRGFSICTYFKAELFCLRALWPEMANLDLSRDAAKIGTPVVLFLGRHDWNTPSSLAEAWLSGISAPSKSVVWFEDSAHCPSFEEPDEFMAAMAGIARHEPLSEQVAVMSRQADLE